MISDSDDCSVWTYTPSYITDAVTPGSTSEGVSSVVASSVVTASVDAEVTDCILPDALLATLAVSLADTELPAGTTA